MTLSPHLHAVLSPLTRVSAQLLTRASPDERRLKFSLTNVGRPSSAASWLSPSSNSLCELVARQKMECVDNSEHEIHYMLSTSLPPLSFQHCHCSSSGPSLSPRSHRAMNLFLRSYPKIWLENMQKTNHLALREKLVVRGVEPGVGVSMEMCLWHHVIVM